MARGLPAGRFAASFRLPSIDARPIALTLLACLPLTLALSWPTAVGVWRTGAFVNTDDAMRIVQVRDWMGGQPWFDLTAHRMGLPPGLPSHWSRVVDLPIAGLVRLFALVWPPDLAERAARIAWPVALQLAMVAAMAYAGGVLAGARAALAAGLLIVLGGIACFQFEPGRVHHHAPQILLLTLATGTMLQGLDPARAGRAAVAGALAVVSFAIGLENLPFLALLLATPAAAWIVVGMPMRAALLWLAASLAVAAPTCFLATVTPGRYAASYVDAFSLMHLVALLAGAALCVGLAALTPRLGSVPSRVSVALAGAVGLAGLLGLAFPGALHGPFYGMDPLMRPFWLDEVREVRPLLRLGAERPATTVTLMAPILLGFAAACAAFVRSRGLARLRWAALVAQIVVGIAGSVWAIRVASSLQPLALLGAAWAVAGAWDAATRDGRAMAMLRPAAALAAGSSLFWAMLPLPDGPAEAAVPSCTAPEAMKPLARLEPGLAFAPIDLGPFLLAHTGLSVLAGPYHRDNAGDHAVIAGFLDEPDEARAVVAAAGARYVLVCGEGSALEARAAPGGLAASLALGRVPAWLAPMTLDAPTPIRVYRVR